MASNSFGNIFKITTWGESHGKAIGVVIDGCPAGVPITEELINHELFLRAPGSNPFVSKRIEHDKAEILSGIFKGQTTGAPISIIIWNHDAKSTDYETIKDLIRPGHANYPYIQKYGIFDYRGGGRASARETACRVAAGAIAKKILSDMGIIIVGYLNSVGSVSANYELSDVSNLKEIKKKVLESPVFCPCSLATGQMIELIQEVSERGDSVGGVVEAVATGLPAGWGDPIYEKLEANLAKAMLSIPATKGFEIGNGFNAAAMYGSKNNDIYYKEDNCIKTKTNHTGGVLGGISIGMPISIRVAFKPPSGIKKEQQSIDFEGNQQIFKIPEGARHDPCVAIRAVPVVEAMFALVLMDAYLMNNNSIYLKK